MKAEMKEPADIRAKATAEETGWTATLDAGKDINGTSQVTTMSVNVEGERALMTYGSG